MSTPTALFAAPLRLVCLFSLVCGFLATPLVQAADTPTATRRVHMPSEKTNK